MEAQFVLTNLKEPKIVSQSLGKINKEEQK